MSILCSRACAIVIICCAVLFVQPCGTTFTTTSIRDSKFESESSESKLSDWKLSDSKVIRSKLIQPLLQRSTRSDERMANVLNKFYVVNYPRRKKRVSHHGQKNRKRRPKHYEQRGEKYFKTKAKTPLISFKDIENNYKNKRSLHRNFNVRQDIVYRDKLVGDRDSLKIVPKSRKRRRRKRLTSRNENRLDNFILDYTYLPVTNDNPTEIEDIIYPLRNPIQITPRANKYAKTEKVVRITPRPVYNSRNYFDEMNGIKLPDKVTIDPNLMNPNPNDTYTYGGQLLRKREATPPIALQSVSLTIPNNISALNIPFTIAEQNVALALHDVSQEKATNAVPLINSEQTINCGLSGEDRNNFAFNVQNVTNMNIEDLTTECNVASMCNVGEVRTQGYPMYEFHLDEPECTTECSFQEYNYEDTTECVTTQECTTQECTTQECTTQECTTQQCKTQECTTQECMTQECTSADMETKAPCLISLDNLENHVQNGFSFNLKGADYGDLEQDSSEDASPCDLTTCDSNTTPCILKFAKNDETTSSSFQTTTEATLSYADENPYKNIRKTVSFGENDEEKDKNEVSDVYITIPKSTKPMSQRVSNFEPNIQGSSTQAFVAKQEESFLFPHKVLSTMSQVTDSSMPKTLPFEVNNQMNIKRDVIDASKKSLMKLIKREAISTNLMDSTLSQIQSTSGTKLSSEIIDNTVSLIRRDAETTACVPSTCAEVVCESSTCPADPNASTQNATESAASPDAASASSDAAAASPDAALASETPTSVVGARESGSDSTEGGNSGGGGDGGGEASDTGCHIPCNVSNTLSEILHNVEKLAEEKLGGAEDFACQLNGSWSSEAAGVKFNIAASDGNVQSINMEPPDVGRQTGFMTNSTWQLSAMLPIANSGIIIINGVNEKDKTVASFIGECKVCRHRDRVSGNWLFVHTARDCDSQQSCFKVLSDFWSRSMVQTLKKQHLMDLINNNNPVSSVTTTVINVLSTSSANPKLTPKVIKA